MTIPTLLTNLKRLANWQSFVRLIFAQERKMNREQNLSPDNPKRFEWIVLNDNYISKNELILLCFLCFDLSKRKNKVTLLYYLLDKLPEKIRTADFLSDKEKMSLHVLINGGKNLLVDSSLPFSYRAVMGLLNNIQLLKKTKHRIYYKIYPRIRVPQRIRGYRDQGTLRPSHTWTPKTDFTLTDQQNIIEDEREQQEMLEQLALSGEFASILNHFYSKER